MKKQPRSNDDLRADFDHLRQEVELRVPDAARALQRARAALTTAVGVAGAPGGRAAADSVAARGRAPRAWAMDRWRGRRWLLVPMGLAAALLVVVLLPDNDAPDLELRLAQAVQDYLADPVLGGWESPTAFLLDPVALPGDELWDGVPALGDFQGFSELARDDAPREFPEGAP